MGLNYCKHLRWVESQDADYYVCALGLESSSDWCDDVVGETSECPKFDPIPYLKHLTRGKGMDEENDDQWVHDWVVDESTWNGWRIFPE